MKQVEKMIEAAFKELLTIDTIGQSKSSGNNLVFPTRRGEKEPRVSEQEMRFLFAKQLEKQSQYAYAVEVPTVKTYSFTGIKKLSSNIDICLYDKANTSCLVSLIEFKAHNPVQQSYSKDFQKLLDDADGLKNYFVQVIRNSDKGTIPNIEEKYKNAIGVAQQQTSVVKIFLCDIGKKTISIYEVVNKSLIKK